MPLRQFISCGLALGLCGWLVAAAADPQDTIPVSSQWQFRAWQTDEGLQDNFVTGVAQGPDGYLWVATFGGLMRFNGMRFEEFSLVHLPEVANRVVHQMLLDSAGRLWLAMDRGSLVCADGAKAWVVTTRDGLPGTRPTFMAEDGRGGLWLAYPDGVVRVAEDKVWPLDANAGLPAKGNYYVANDGRGTVWIATGNQLGRKREGRWEAVHMFPQPGLRLTRAADAGLWVCAGNGLFRYEPGHEPVQVAQLPPQVRVRTLLADREGTLWIATDSDGLFCWSDGRLGRVPTSHSQISSLTQDREGNLWVGTAGGGLNRLRVRTVEVIGMNEGLPYESMRSVCEDTNGVRWAVTDNGLLLRQLVDRWEITGPESGWNHGAVASCVAAGPDGSVWVGMANARLVRLRHGESREWSRAQNLTGGLVRSILVAANGDVWVATGGRSPLHRLREDVLEPVELDREVRSSLRAMAETADGTIWVGAADGLLVRVNPKTLKAESFFPEERPLSIRFLSATPEGSLWIGYAGWGIGRWKDGRHARLTAAQGLYDDYISQMLPDERGNLWFNSNHGLFVVRLAELIDVFEGRARRVHSISYGRGEGLPSLQPRCDYYPSVWRMAGGSLFFALRNGLAVVRSERMVENQQQPPVVIERVAIDERTVARHAADFSLLPAGDATNRAVAGTEARLMVPPAHRKIEIEFAALSFSSPENLLFSYRLRNFDQEWTEAGSSRQALYPRLPAGDYEFEVEACNEAGLWSETTQRVGLRVLPFFWETWWFRGGLLVAFTGGVAAAVRYVSFRRLRRRMAALEQQAVLDKERARIAKDLHDDLGASMTQMTLLLELAMQQRAAPAAAIARVEEGLRAGREAIKSLDAAVWAVNPANNTLPELVAYIGQFAMEFLHQAGVRCELDLPDHPPERPVSAELRHDLFLIVKEALHNVVRHAQAGEVRLHMSLAAATLRLRIEDDGRGMEQEHHDAQADGLRNMRQRAEALKGRFALASQPGRGTCITVECPLGGPF